MFALIAALVGWYAIAPDSTHARAALLSAVPADAGLSAQTAPDPTAIRSRFVTIDVAALPDTNRRARVAREPSLTLELFPDIAVLAVFDRYDENANGVTWVGHVDRVAMSSVTLVYSDDLLAGSVVMPGASYSIRPASEEVRRTNTPAGRAVHVVTEVNQAGFLREAPPIEVQLPPDVVAAANDVAMTDTADFVDVMVLYTQTAMTSSGGATAMQNLINLAVSETNTSYANSGVTQRLRLVNTGLVNYTESNNFSTNLNELRSGAGALSGVAALRETFRADLVTLLVRPQQPEACGVGFLMTNVSAAFAPSGFNVVDASCIANFTYAHELGHNMGARHDWYMDNATTPFSYAHGFVNAAPSQRWRTIMAYPDHCTDQGFSCSRVLYWASPTRQYLPYCAGRGFNCNQLQYWFFPGSAMGVPGGTNITCRAGIVPGTACDADDSRALNATALTVANFRQTLAPLVSGERLQIASERATRLRLRRRMEPTRRVPDGRS